MILPADFPYRFFNPLTSKHREDYIHVLLSLESVLEQAKRIALPRNALMAEMRRTFHRENYALDVSDEEDYDEESTDDPEQDNLAFTIRLFLRSGWIDTDESGDHITESVFLTQYGKKLTSFLRDLAKMEDQSGHVVNTYSNLQQVRTMPENGLICIQNAYESTQRLLTNIEVMYAKIKRYYATLLENTKPEELLAGHLHGYVKDVVDKMIFPIKVDDSVDRFKGPILNLVSDIESDTHLLEQIISFAVQTKRVSSVDEGWTKSLMMLNYIKYNFDDIESYIQQLDEKNQTYIRITRQKLSYMLSMDTSIKGDITLIIFHGGFYSQSKRKFFRVIADNLPPTVETKFWGDIDLGGFLMFTRLKQDLFPSLVPYRMDLCEYENYRTYGIERNVTYLDLLRQRMEDKSFDAFFTPVVEAILSYGQTVEQEIML